MQIPRSSPLLRLAAAAVLVLAGAGLASCGDDDDASTGSTGSTGADGASTESPADADTDAESDDDSDDETDAAAEAALADAMGEDRAFDLDADGMATAMRSATQADRVEVDGSTFRLHFDDGSKDDARASINCRALTTIAADDDVIVLVYPDGEVHCAEAG